MSLREKLIWLGWLITGVIGLGLCSQVRVHGAESQGNGWQGNVPEVPKAMALPVTTRTYRFAATATGTNGLESDYSSEAVLTVSNRIQSVTCAWDAPASNGIAGYTLYQGTAAGCYTNSVRTTNTQATIRVNPPVPSNLVVTVTSSGCTNLQYRQAVGASWTGWALLGCTNLTNYNPIYPSREWRGVGRPTAAKIVSVKRVWQ